jgi:hypothetical protein
MRQIICGSVYDTDTAHELYSTNSDNPVDCETLYRSKSGKFFDYFFNECSDKPCMSITPLSRQGALIWAFRATGNLNEAKRIVGFDEDITGTKQISVRIPMRTYRILRETAAERNMSMASIIEEMADGSYGADDYYLDDGYEQYLESLSDAELLEAQRMIKEQNK